MIDSFKHQGMRKQLVALLTEKGIRNIHILQAIGKVPRHFFMDSQFDKFAYQDMAFKIDAGQTISQPYTVARQTELLELERGMKVLEIGTGSGYQTCILLELGARVYTIERQRILYEKAKVQLTQMKYHPKFFFGDGYAGLPAFAPFDRILVTCGAPEIPDALVKQLKPGGIMVIPVGEGDVQIMKVIRKNNEGEINISDEGNYRFVPMLKNKSGT
ncbi:MAG: protein-L-isoaspartate(D-aspartate) O-methyltransferase [Candidatus Competibacteraceae bacterium]|nr:protein-L-isoaspartate(D-aspartate) O-methyltransferase [Candidatus Competibacteraceae bacterium]